MDGYNQYPWNQDQYQYGAVYPPSHEGVNYDNWRSFDYNCQMKQVPSYYQEWRNDEASFSPQESFLSYEDEYYGQQFYPQDEFAYQRASERFSCDDERSFEYDDQMLQAPSHYQEVEQSEGRATVEEMLILLMKKNEMRDEEDKKFQASVISKFDSINSRFEEINSRFEEITNQMVQNGSKLKSLHLQFEQLTHIVKSLQEEDEKEEVEKEEGPSDEDVNSIKNGEEECSMVDMSKQEKENQEAFGEQLKSEMSISHPLNSSICTLIDVDISYDFILPLDRNDQRKELKENLGILEQNGREWREKEERLVEKSCKDFLDGWSIFHEKLHDFEAQRMAYNGNEDRYPWPFR